MHAFIVTGGTRETRIKTIDSMMDAWGVDQFDRLHVFCQESSIGIEDIRTVFHGLNRSPRTSSFITVTIHTADTMTPQAQHALLKTLEEPPPKVKFFIETQKSDSMLPTIISRCEVISVHPSSSRTKQIDTTDGDALFSPSIGVRLQAIDRILKTYPDTKQYVEELTERVHEKISEPSVQTVLSRVIKSQFMYQIHVQPRTILDWIFIFP